MSTYGANRRHLPGESRAPSDGDSLCWGAAAHGRAQSENEAETHSGKSAWPLRSRWSPEELQTARSHCLHLKHWEPGLSFWVEIKKKKKIQMRTKPNIPSRVWKPGFRLSWMTTMHDVLDERKVKWCCTVTLPGASVHAILLERKGVLQV